MASDGAGPDWAEEQTRWIVLRDCATLLTHRAMLCLECLLKLAETEETKKGLRDTVVGMIASYMRRLYARPEADGGPAPLNGEDLDAAGEAILRVLTNYSLRRGVPDLADYVRDTVKSLPAAAENRADSEEDRKIRFLLGRIGKAEERLGLGGGREAHR